MPDPRLDTTIIKMENLGSNLGYVDELYARFLENPESVSKAWREFFADYNPGPSSQAAPSQVTPLGGELILPPPAGTAPGVPVTDRPLEPEAQEEVEAPEGAEPVRGVAARIVENMEASLAIPTATSARTIPVKLLEENRRLINQNQAAIRGFKVSFTHMIAWVIVRAIEKHPVMNSGFIEVDGAPHRVPRNQINLGLAIDLEKRGERLLLVPNIKDAGSLDFPTFAATYDDMVIRTRQGKLSLEDFRDTTVTLTNPGMIGTVLSVPRLMTGQGTIVGTGAIGYPAEYSGMAPAVISELGLSKVMTVTSTYDHRIIQGAESGSFLLTLEKLLLGDDGFYDRIFSDLHVPHEPVRWAGDQNPTVFTSPESTEAIEKQARVIQMIRSYRVRGHLWADLDPLGYDPQPHPDLELSHWGLTLWDLDRRFIAEGLAGIYGTLTLREILDILRETYCRKIGVEFMHIPEPEIRSWLQEEMERTRNAKPLPEKMPDRILTSLNRAEAFERFLHSTYIGHKRFSLEGAEVLIPMLEALLDDASASGVEEVIIGMAHRGRLNVLANIVGKSYDAIFREFEGDVDPTSMHGSGDVKYHLGATGTYTSPRDHAVRLNLASNPSHLEAVDPVVEGMTRARQDWLGDDDRERVLPVILHGDAAFAGQGIVAETLNLSLLKGYRTGGTIHIIINNQIGFTTGPADARSTFYATDLAKMIRSPIFHVNGDHPEAVVRTIQLAFAFRQEFKRDAVIDLVCYRRWGHNEADDPSYTHPILYSKIEKHRSVRKLYTEELLRRGVLNLETAEKSLIDFQEILENAFKEVHEAQAQEPKKSSRMEVRPMQPMFRPQVATTAPRETLEAVLDGIEKIPEDFKPHPKLIRQLSQRRERFQTGKIDWALAEALAFGALLLEGTPVRLSGEDTGRGTFSQRHGILYDYETGKPYIPLMHLREGQARFMIYDSLLSEQAVVGFEYGYSVNYPEALVIWEAQFGDFANGAQIIIDQFVASAEDKWEQKSSLVLLLPHGYEGQGPEHSSARVERFLQLAARDNLRIAHPSTPAQYFHLLRRQVREAKRKPLIVLTPKSLLRNPEAVSRPEAFSRGGFDEVLEDPQSPSPEEVRRVILTSGKLYYTLNAHRLKTGSKEVALLRVEQFHPYPAEWIARAISRYSDQCELIWAQEEPRNMGAWTFLQEKFHEDPATGRLGRSLRYIGRQASPSPATGSFKRHAIQERALLDEAFAGLAGVSHQISK